MYAIAGWLAGVAFALLILTLNPTLDVVQSALLGFTLSMVGLLLGELVERNR